MSWIESVAGAVGLRHDKVGEAVRHAAIAIDVLDAHCQTLGAGLSALDIRQSATEALQSEHEWALASLREEIEQLRQALQQAVRQPSSIAVRSHASLARSAAAEGLGPRVQPSDLHGFLDALPPVDTGDEAIAAAVRTLVTAAWDDLRREPLPHDRFPWHQPILLLASAPVERLEAFVERLIRHNPAPELWLIGRTRDQRSVAGRLRRPFRFFDYCAPGPYSASQCGGFLPSLREVPFGALVFLDTGLWGDRLEHCSELLQSISRENVYCYGSDEHFYHLADSPARNRAQALTQEVLDWYDARLIPAGDAQSECEP